MVAARIDLGPFFSDKIVIPDRSRTNPIAKFHLIQALDNFRITIRLLSDVIHSDLTQRQDLRWSCVTSQPKQKQLMYLMLEYLVMLLSNMNDVLNTVYIRIVKDVASIFRCIKSRLGAKL